MTQQDQSFSHYLTVKRNYLLRKRPVCNVYVPTIVSYKCALKDH